ncbi:MAG TPA: alpha-E domain-containing protein [Aeromicrobium sp.]|nr:alpha-E domain-containing protein [Aeromicrobium sp.]
MLSRIAESLFWIGRYLERADDTSRILDVQLQVLIEDPGAGEGPWSARLLDVMGVEEPAGEFTRQGVLDRLAYDRDSRHSIVFAVDRARDNARGTREILSTEMWAAINTLWQGMGTARLKRPPEFLSWVRNRAALIAGVADSTMTRDEGWHFFELGRRIERIDMTARLLASAALASDTQLAWPTTLRGCGAYEAFLRAYRGLETDREAIEFLLLDRWFPRSIVFSLAAAERALGSMEEAEAQRAGFADEAQRLLGRARTDLEYRPLSDIIADLPNEMESLQQTCAQASEAITARYFAQ